MLSCVSWQTRSITSNGSTPSASHRRAVSLANVIFSAWKLLQQYLTISAARIEVTWNSHGRCPKSSRSLLPAAFARIGPDDREWRLVVVADRRSFAQELRLEAEVEALAVLLPRFALDDRTQHLLDRSGHQRRSEHDDVRARHVAQARRRGRSRGGAWRTGPGCRWMPMACRRRSATARVAARASRDVAWSRRRDHSRRPAPSARPCLPRRPESCPPRSGRAWPDRCRRRSPDARPARGTPARPRPRTRDQIC